MELPQSLRQFLLCIIGRLLRQEVFPMTQSCINVIGIREKKYETG